MTSNSIQHAHDNQHWPPVVRRMVGSGGMLAQTNAQCSFGVFHTKALYLQHHTQMGHREWINKMVVWTQSPNVAQAWLKYLQFGNKAGTLLLNTKKSFLIASVTVAYKAILYFCIEKIVRIFGL